MVQTETKIYYKVFSYKGDEIWNRILTIPWEYTEFNKEEIIDWEIVWMTNKRLALKIWVEVVKYI